MKTLPGVRASERGFTLIELLIVIAILGLLASMLIPNLLDAMQKAKQKKTVADMRIMGTAMFAWLTDQVGAAAAGADEVDNTVEMSNYQGSVKSVDQVRGLLMPRYVQEVPRLDGWKYSYEYYLNDAEPLSREVMMMRSRGVDNVADADQYQSASFLPTDYKQDIVWADGFFVRWPEGANIEAPPAEEGN
ncbi:MAG TPA: prepilin-type N-terminal cleavage/methylation domain-containing protein [Thermoanaerobaculia bacterium]|nr:prepilin-type N-terminal cleavage/methylation domain-containing protein [Thermoanaerobaculia bacterium]